jgi:ABC-type branched-subunit amino acid transport system substrate-binding protein
LFIILAVQLTLAQDQPVFRIGVLDNEEGSISRGAMLAVQQVNARGGIQGADGTFFRLELVVQPTHSGTTLAEAAANLNQASVIAVLGPVSTNEVLSNLSTLQSLNVPVLTPAIGDTVITSDTSGRLFRSRAAEVHQGRALANYLINDLGIQHIATVQLDIDSTAGVIGFSTAAAALGVQPQPAILLDTNTDIPQIANSIIQANSQIVVVYGNPNQASTLYNTLRSSGWPGLFAYNQAESNTFRDEIPKEQLNGIISTTTWPFTAPDSASENFLLSYVRTYGEIPGPIEAASYDSVLLLAEAIGRPGELQANLAALDNIIGVQGLLRPAQLSRGETTNYVAVIQLGEFGAPEVLARYAGNQRVDIAQPVGPIPTATPTVTPTPEGVVITITSARQNVRTGPGLNYDVIGQLSQGDQAQVIGATADNSWVVINFRGQQGWLATYLLDVFGDLNTVPIITPPPTPTPAPTNTPPPLPDIVIDSAIAVPSPIVPNQPFIVTVTVRNAGSGNAGQFAIAATFPPNNVYSSAIVPGLAAGQTTVANLSGTLMNTGFYSVVIVGDLNNDVTEGNEANNNLTFNYRVDKLILNQGVKTFNPGDTIDLEGNLVQGDANWDGSALNAIFGAQLGIINGVTLDTVHWDLINPSVVNQASIPNGSMTTGTIIGIITADGNRGVMRVDAPPGGQLTVTFRVYQN